MNTYVYYVYRKYLLYYLHSTSQVPKRCSKKVERVFSCYVLFSKYPHDRSPKQVSCSCIFIICYCIISKHSVITRFTPRRLPSCLYCRPHTHYTNRNRSTLMDRNPLCGHQCPMDTSSSLYCQHCYYPTCTTVMLEERAKTATYTQPRFACASVHNGHNQTISLLTRQRFYYNNITYTRWVFLTR